jgi:hypothetical protein
MRDAPDVPKLVEDQSTGLMHRVCDTAPRLHLLSAVNAGSPGVTLALHRHLRCFAHDQRRGCALRVVTGGERARHITRLARARPGQRRHDDAMRQLEGAKPVGLEQQIYVGCLSRTGRLRGRGYVVHIRAHPECNDGPKFPLCKKYKGEAMRLN